jgi:cephalosporin-C deacetylase
MTHKPNDYEQYWQSVSEELAALPLAAELTELPMRSNAHGQVFALKYTSLDAYRIFAYFCVPNGTGRFPCLVQMPRYGSVNHIPSYEARQNYVCIQVCHRGQRLSDSPYAAAYPGLLTDGVENAAHYIYRGIVADCMRAIEFVSLCPEVNPNRISVVGNELALLAAAHIKAGVSIDSVIYHPELFYNAVAMAALTDSYPLEEINDYLRAHPAQAAAVRKTLSYFNPLHGAELISATTLLVSGNDKDLFSPERMQPLAAALGGPVERRISEHSSYRDGAFEAAWLAQRHGVPTVLPNHWR